MSFNLISKNFYKFLLVSLFILFGLLGLPKSSWAADFYITQNVSGANTGADCANAHAVSWFNASGNWSNPKQADKIGPADIVHLCGTFTGTPGNAMLTVRGSGSSGSPITILFESGAILQNVHWGTNAAIKAIDVSHISVDGGTNGIIQATDNGSASLGFTYQERSTGIMFYPCTYCEVKHLTIRNMYVRTETDSDYTCDSSAFPSSNNGIAAGNDITGLRVHDNVIYDAMEGINSFFQQNSSDVEVYNNTIYHTASPVSFVTINNNLTNLSIHDNKAYDAYPWNDPNNYFHIHGFLVMNVSYGYGIFTNVNIYNNYMYGTQGSWTNSIGPHQTGGIWFACDYPDYKFVNVNIYNNILTTGTVSEDYPKNGLLSVQGCTNNLLVANNTFIGLEADKNGIGFMMGEMGTRSNTTVKNNVFSNIIIPLYIYSRNRIASDNNIFFHPDPQFITDSWLGFSDWKAASGNDSHSVTSNPNLTSEYKLQASSNAAINNGVSLSSYFTTDKDGFPRPQGSAWDIGAYEYIGASDTTPPAPPSGVIIL